MIKHAKESQSNSDQSEDSVFDEEQGVEPIPPPEIFSYNELRSCSDLSRMYKDGILEIKPDFQREFVWGESERTRFVDSLIKQLPIPSMCFSLDFRSKKWQVIDGLQRMYTIVRFLSEDTWELSKLPDVNPKISGKSVSEIKMISGELYKRVENLTIPITIIRCDYKDKNHMEYLFTIFHRLNTGGAKLNGQGIRNCIYSGELNEFIKTGAKEKTFVKLFGITKQMVKRMRDAELALRFFAFQDSLDKYKRLAGFLNDYMYDHRHPSEQWIDEKNQHFKNAIDFLNSISSDFPKFEKKNAAFKETVLFGIAKNIKTLRKKDKSDLVSSYNKLANHESMSEQQISKAVMDKKKVIERMHASRKIFSEA